MEPARRGSAVRALLALLALRRVSRGRVVRHGARLFTEGGRGLLPEIAEALPGLVAGGYVVVEALKPGGAGRGVLRVTTAGWGLLAELERARAQPIQWARQVPIEPQVRQPEQHATIARLVPTVPNGQSSGGERKRIGDPGEHDQGRFRDAADEARMGALAGSVPSVRLCGWSSAGG